MRVLQVALMMTVGLAAAPPAQADLIVVDTGPGGFQGGEPIFRQTNNPSNFQYLAAEFSVSQAWEITSVQGWIDPFEFGDVLFRLYSDGGDVPGAPLFEQSLRIPGSLAPTTWYGPSGLSWLIGPGSYWLAFEVPTLVADIFGFLGVMRAPSVTPLINEAVSNDSTVGYVGQDNLDFGVRVFANAVNGTPVPEPASILLVCTGLIGAGMRRCRKRRAS